MSNAERLSHALGPIFGSMETQVDEALIERMIAALAPLTTDDLVCEMAGGGSGFSTTREGTAGMREAWRDWLETFAWVSLEFENIEETGENVIVYVRQVGTTRHDEIEIEQPSAAVWKFRNDRIYRIEFHLDRRAAERSAAEQLRQ